ncbi:hypothetical protein BC941DRAFT_442735 [Chlamydoabsidia padenii]|nr:hypothetical protein BC941DRAFT_442735 [Chlamydoabsidia padenii]
MHNSRDDTPAGLESTMTAQNGKDPQGSFCGQSSNNFILLDSDDDDNGVNDTNEAGESPKQKNSLSPFDAESWLESPPRFRSPVNDEPRSSSPIHILLSPSPPRHDHDHFTSWNASPYDIDSPFSPSSATLFFDTDPLSNKDPLVSSPPPSRGLSYDSVSTNTDALVISDDDDSMDSLPSTADLLSQLSQGLMSKKGKQVDTTNSLLLSSEQLKEWENVTSSSPSSSLANDTLQGSKKAAKATQRKVDQEAKKQARALALLQKEQAKAETLRLKEQAKQLQQVNRLRKDRSELIKEMTVVVKDVAFMQSEHGILLRTVLNEKGSRVITNTNTASYTLTWQMECRAEWDEHEQQFVPFANGATKLKQEPSALVFMTAEAFIHLIHEDRIETWIDGIQQQTDKQLFLMIEGLEGFYKKKMNWMRRQFTSTVLGNMTDSSASDNNGEGRSKRRKQQDMALLEHGPSRDQIEDALTFLQVIKNVMLIQTVNEEDSIDWLVCLTTDLARGTYHTINTAGLFKGQAATIKSGTDADDVWSKMLQEIQHCTPAVAKSVTQNYPNAMALYQKYTHMDPSTRDNLLADLEVKCK